MFGSNLSVVAAIIIGLGQTVSQESALDKTDDPVAVSKRSFKIPLVLDPARREQVKEMSLFMSADQGREWELCATATPDQELFPVTVPSDGEYWFSVSILDKHGNRQPEDVTKTPPNQKVLVDTEKPDVRIVRSEIQEADKLVVAWEIEEKNPDLATLTLEYRAANAPEGKWRKLRFMPDLTGEREFRLVQKGPVSVRMGIKDLAGNYGEAVVDQIEAPAAGVVHPGPMPNIQHLNTCQVSFDYEVTKIGTSGIGKVELWMTKDDGRTWEYLTDDPDMKSPITTTLPGEGAYGISLVVQSGAGRSKGQPTPGALPEIRVEADCTPPVVHLHEPKPDPNRSDVLLLSWKASDRNLTANPITLEWAENDVWNVIATDLPNTGSHAWQLPPKLPARVRLRLTVVDLAGNRGVAETQEPVLVDFCEPEGRIIGISAKPIRPWTDSARGGH